MMVMNEQITDHYSEGGLLARIAEGLTTLGKTPSSATIEDLAPVDEFHIGGRGATVDLCEQMNVLADSVVLDVGCGIGGTARFVHSTFGCHVTGIDLTPEYIEVARTLSNWVGLSEQLSFEVGSALEMPFADASFDRAMLLHVGMNIEDKQSLFREVFRVLRPFGRFGIYDIMRQSTDDPAFPVPWATDSSMSFVESPSTYREALTSAGFEVVAERGRGEFAVDFFEALQQRTVAAQGPPPLGLHVIMGSDAPTKIANMVEAVRAGALAPVEQISIR